MDQVDKSQPSSDKEKNDEVNEQLERVNQLRREAEQLRKKAEDSHRKAKEAQSKAEMLEFQRKKQEQRLEEIKRKLKMDTLAPPSTTAYRTVSPTRKTVDLEELQSRLKKFLSAYYKFFERLDTQSLKELDMRDLLSVLLFIKDNAEALGISEIDIEKCQDFIATISILSVDMSRSEVDGDQEKEEMVEKEMIYLLGRAEAWIRKISDEIGLKL
jgi:hypothetical protein